MADAAKTVPLTEFEKLEPDELHLVKHGANGFSPVLEKQVLDAIENAEKGDGHEENTPSDEAADIEAQMTKAGVSFCGGDIEDCEVCAPWLEKAATLDDVAKAKLKMKDRKKLPKGDFAIPEKAPKSGSYPINDRSHAANALSRSSGKPEESRVRAAVRRKYPDMGKKGAATKSPGVPDFATQAPKEAGHVADTGRSGKRIAPMTAGTKPPARVTTPGSETQAVGGSNTVVIPIEERVIHPPAATLAAKTAYSYAELARALDQVAAQREARAEKDTPWIDAPAGDAATNPGSSLWESYDRATLTEIAQTLAECGKAIDAVQQREAVEAIKNPADLRDAADLGAACDALDCALSIVARLAFVEGAEKSEEDLEKAGFQFSPMTTATLLAAHDHLGKLIDARNRNHAGESGDTEANEIMLTMTKEELAAQIKEGATAAVKDAVDASVKKSLKKFVKELRKGMSSNNGGEVSEGDIKAIVGKRVEANDPKAAISDATVNKASEEELTKSAEKLEKRLKKMKKQRKLAKAAGNSAEVESLGRVIKETHDLVQRIANRPRVGGPRLDGQLPPGVAPVVEGRQGEQATKSADDQEIESLKKQIEAEKDPSKKERLSWDLTRKQLIAGHRSGELNRNPLVGALPTGPIPGR